MHIVQSIVLLYKFTTVSMCTYYTNYSTYRYEYMHNSTCMCIMYIIYILYVHILYVHVLYVLRICIYMYIYVNIRTIFNIHV